MRDDHRHFALDEQQLDALWGGVDERLRRRRRRRRATFVTVAVASALLLVLGGVRLAGRWRAPSPALQLASGVEVPLRADGAVVQNLALSDGSVVHLEPSAHVELLENSARAFGLALRQGSIDVQVRPGGERMWSVETRLATIQVIGTQFRVDHAEHTVRVSVRAGVVLVRGETVPGRVRRLEAGEELLVEERVGALAPAVPASAPVAPAPPAPAPTAPVAPAPSASAPTAPVAPAPTAPVAPAPSVSVPGAPAAPSTPASPRPGRVAPPGTPRHVGSSGASGRVESPATPERVESPAVPERVESPASPEPRHSRATLISLADQARRRGQLAEAVALYDKIVSTWPVDPDAGVVAFTRARLQANELAQPAAAARGFEQALRLGLPKPLVEEAALQRFDQWRLHGDTSAARRAALDYLLHHPGGEARERVRAWLLQAP